MLIFWIVWGLNEMSVSGEETGTRRGNLKVHTHTLTHTHIYSVLCVCVCVCIHTYSYLKLIIYKQVQQGKYKLSFIFSILKYHCYCSFCLALFFFSVCLSGHCINSILYFLFDVLFFHWIHANKCVCAKSLQSCLTLCDPIDCSLPGSSVYGILQARILELVAISFSRGPSPPRDRTSIS